MTRPNVTPAGSGRSSRTWTGRSPPATFQQAKADHNFNEQELELKTNTELTREIDRLTTELQRRLIDQRSQQKK
jgi:hypothetical protein